MGTLFLSDQTLFFIREKQKLFWAVRAEHLGGDAAEVARHYQDRLFKKPGILYQHAYLSTLSKHEKKPGIVIQNQTVIWAKEKENDETHAFHTYRFKKKYVFEEPLPLKKEMGEK